MSFVLKSTQEVMQEIAARVKAIRLEQNLSQEGLSLRSGVSLGSLKRFERTGEISLKSLIEISVSLGVMEDFDKMFVKDTNIESLFNKKEPKIRKRGSVK